MELGGAWALGKPTFPIVVPPMTVQTAAAYIGETLMASLGSADDIEDMLHGLPELLRSADARFAIKFEPRNVREFKERLAPVPAERPDRSFSSASNLSSVGGQAIASLQLTLDDHRLQYRITEIVQGQVEVILSLDALKAPVNVPQEKIVQVHAERLAEPPREVQRLHFLRGWSHGQTIEQLSAGAAGTGCRDGGGGAAGSSVGLGGSRVRGPETGYRLGADLTELDSEGAGRFRCAARRDERRIGGEPPAAR